MNKNYYSDEVLKMADQMVPDYMSNIFKKIKEAQIAAEQEHIRANAVAIRKDSNAFKGLVKSKRAPLSSEMILGLDLYITDELPEEFGFCLFEASNTKKEIEYRKIRDEILEELRNMTLSELAAVLYREEEWN